MKTQTKAFFVAFIFLVLASCSNEKDIDPTDSFADSEFLAKLKFPALSSNDKAAPSINTMVDKASRTEGALTIAIEGSGSANLLRNKNGVSVQVHSTGLTSGNAYTAWFIILEGGNPPIVVNAAGHVVGGSGSGSFSGHLSIGAIGAVNGTDILGNGDDGSFDDPLGSTVLIHIVDHGPAGVDGPGTIPENIHEITGADGLAQEWTFLP